ncbi:MAG: ThuA domain-containing protein [Chloroflexi bacterium]|nr:ThuA domain-containing protein [Chloroflexota bacterium]
MKLLLITGGSHPYEETTPVLSGFLSAAGHDVTVSETAEELASGAMGAFDTIILNTRRRDDSDNDFSIPQREGLKSFVESGGGLISVHISPDSAPGWPEMKPMTGGGWVSGTSWHPPFGEMSVHIKNPDHPLAAGVSDFETTDECYCGLDIQPGIDVFMVGDVEDEERPLGWSTTYGKGKVANIALGHAGVSAEHPSFQRLILNSVEYVNA